MIWFAAALIVAQPQEVAGWDLAEVDDGCGMMMTYAGEGETELYVIEKVDGQISVVVRNSNWSVRKGQDIPMTFWLDNHPFTGEVAGLDAASGKPGFGIKANSAFRQAFAKAGGLTIMRGEVTVDDLSLKGSGAAAAALTRCVNRVRSRLAAEKREKDRFAHIAKDPFATSKAAAARGNPASWVTNDDYPPDALRQGQQGSVEVDVKIDTEGRISACTTKASSGHSSLDTATCRLVMRRGRFEPATNEAGEPIEGSDSLKYRWELSR